MNYAINLLEDSLETEQRTLEAMIDPNMKRIIKDNVDDLELAIHNLKMLETK